MTLLFEFEAVVFVNSMVDPAHTLIVSLEAAGIVVKLVLVIAGVWAKNVPFATKANKLATIQIIWVSSFLFMCVLRLFSNLRRTRGIKKFELYNNSFTLLYPIFKCSLPHFLL